MPVPFRRRTGDRFAHANAMDALDGIPVNGLGDALDALLSLSRRNRFLRQPTVLASVGGTPTHKVRCRGIHARSRSETGTAVSSTAESTGRRGPPHNPCTQGPLRGSANPHRPSYVAPQSPPSALCRGVAFNDLQSKLNSRFPAIPFGQTRPPVATECSRPPPATGTSRGALLEDQPCGAHFQRAIDQRRQDACTRQSVFVNQSAYGKLTITGANANVFPPKLVNVSTPDPPLAVNVFRKLLSPI